MYTYDFKSPLNLFYQYSLNFFFFEILPGMTRHVDRHNSHVAYHITTEINIA